MKAGRGWQTKQLGDLCEVLDNQRKPVTKRDRNSGIYPYYGATGIKDYVDGYLFDEPLVLVGEDGAKWGSGDNTAFAIDGKCWVNNHAHVLRPNRTVIADNWLIHFLVHSDLSEFVSGLTVPKLNQGELRSIPIPCPPLPEQKRIVSILDEAFEGIATAKANAEQNVKYSYSLFVHHLEARFHHRGQEWVETTLGEIAQIKGGKRVPKGRSLLEEKTSHPYLRVTDFCDSGTINQSDLKYIDDEIYAGIKKYIINPCDLYISIAGTIGKTGIIPKELAGANLTENACRLVFQSNIKNAFVYYFTLTEDFIRQTGLNTRTAAQPKLSLQRLATTRLRIPSIETQEKLVMEFANLRTECQNLESIYRQRIAALDELKKSLLHKAFAGEL